ARGDAVALLGLPEHYREDAAIDHVRALTTGPAGATAPLNPGEATALSYAAIYHPWLVVTESGALRRVPPDGPAAGLLAGRALSRGFVLLSADTLAPGEDLRPLNVRRLLILLRRAALQLGATYVFEPNGDAFRR